MKTYVVIALIALCLLNGLLLMPAASSYRLRSQRSPSCFHSSF